MRRSRADLPCSADAGAPGCFGQELRAPIEAQAEVQREATPDLKLVLRVRRGQRRVSAVRELERVVDVVRDSRLAQTGVARRIGVCNGE